MASTTNLFHQQVILFLTMYIGYLLYMVVRKSFAFSMPSILEEGEMEKVQVGKVLSSFSMGYTIGKFGWGIVADTTSPRLLFSAGLLTSSLLNVVSSYCTTHYFIYLWFMNGIMQGTGWPACAKLANSWYSPQSLGSVWSMLSTCMNMASTGGLILFSYYLDGNSQQWRNLTMLVALVGCVFSLLSYIMIRDSPHKEPDVILGESSTKKKPSSTNGWVIIMTSQYILILAWASCVTMYLKGALIDWGRIYIQEEKAGSAMQASGFIATIEIGGLCGRIFSGFISDRLTSWYGVSLLGNPRNIWVSTCWLGECISLYLLIMLDSNGFLLTLLGFLIGFFLYGIITIVGLLSMEAAAPDIKGKTFALCGLIGNVGLTLSGYPFSLLMEYTTWNNIMYLNIYLCVSNLVMFIYSQYIVCKVGFVSSDDSKLA